MKDRIGNELAVGAKVLVALPEAQIFGFVAQIEDAGTLELVGGLRDRRPGRVLVSCVIALPVDAVSGDGSGAVAQLVRVVDPDAHAEMRPN